MDYLAYMTYPAVIALLLVGMKICKKGEWNSDFLGMQQTKYFQGFLAICIMLHHIGQEMCASWQKYLLFPGLNFFVPLGYLFVGLFFLFSGYGLYTSFMQKPDYLAKGFFKRRALPLLIGYYASAWVFYIARIIMGQKMSAWESFCYISGISLANPYAWFALTMPLFYLFFYISFKFFKKRQILVVTILVFIYTFIGTCINHNEYLMRGQWWYNCVHLFWIGLLIAKYKEKLLEWSKKNYVIKLVACILLFHAFWTLTQVTQGRFSYYGEDAGLPRLITIEYRWICLICEMLCSTAYAFMILLAGMKIRIGNKFLGFMGKITLEFYLIHGLVIELFSYRFCDVVKPIVRIKFVPLMVLVVTVLSIPLALGFKKICHINLPHKDKEKHD